MAKLDSNLYGSDPMKYANSITADALKPPSPPRQFETRGAEGNDPDHESPEVSVKCNIGSQDKKGSEGN